MRRANERACRTGAFGPHVHDPRQAVSGAAAEAQRPAPPSGRGHHLAPDHRAGRVPLRALHRADPARDRHGGRARGRDRDALPARHPLAGQRDADRKRGRLRPACPGHGARRLVEPARLVDLRRDRRCLAPLQVRVPLARRAHLQSVQHRPRPLLPAPPPDQGRAARLLVGADVGLARRGARDHRCRRIRHPPAAEAAAGGTRLLGDVRRGDRSARPCRPHDDRTLAPRPDLGLPAVVGARHLARGARVPLLHDHRPEDCAALPERPAGLCDFARIARGGADRTDDDRVRGEGRAARLARARLPRAAAAAPRSNPTRPTAGRRHRGGRCRRLGRGNPHRQRAPRRRCFASAAAGCSTADHDPPGARGPDETRPPHGSADRPRPARRETVDGRRPAPRLARPGRGAGPADGDGPAGRAQLSLAPDRGRALGAPLGDADTRGRARAGEHGAARRPADERRVRRRSRLPAGGLPVRRLEGEHGDDGRRGLLARLQRRRLAGPVRRQLVLQRRHGAMGGARRAAAHAAVRERSRALPQRHRDSPRRPSGARRRLRGSGSERRRPARLDRDDDDRDQAALEQRQRHLHRGCAGRRDDRVGLVHGGRRRGRERRRPPGRVRGRLHTPVRHRPELARGVPDEPRRESATSSS